MRKCWTVSRFSSCIDIHVRVYVCAHVSIYVFVCMCVWFHVLGRRIREDSNMGKGCLGMSRGLQVARVILVALGDQILWMRRGVACPHSPNI